MRPEYESEKIRELLQHSLSKKVCDKHPIGALIETTDGVYIFGWNGPPTKGIEHNECLRKGYPSGKGMEICPTVHAEIKAICHAAQTGTSLHESTIYLNEWFPCDNCAKAIVEAGITTLVTPDEFYEDKKKHTLIEKLRNQPYNFEMAEKLIREAGIEVIIDPLIRP